MQIKSRKYNIHANNHSNAEQDGNDMKSCRHFQTIQMRDIAASSKAKPGLELLTCVIYQRVYKSRLSLSFLLSGENVIKEHKVPSVGEAEVEGNCSDLTTKEVLL